MRFRNGRRVEWWILKLEGGEWTFWDSCSNARLARKEAEILIARIDADWSLWRVARVVIELETGKKR